MCLQIIALEGKSALRIYDQNSARPLHTDKNREISKNTETYTERKKENNWKKH